MFCFELARRATEAATALASVAAHPGYAATNLQFAGPAKFYERAVMAVGNKVIAQSAKMGALPTLYAATVPDLPERIVRRPRRVHGGSRSPARRQRRGQGLRPRGLDPALGPLRAADRRDVRVRGRRSGVTDLRSDGAAALEWAARYLERVGELPVLAQVKPGEIRAALPSSAPDEPEPFSAVLR